MSRQDRSTILRNYNVKTRQQHDYLEIQTRQDQIHLYLHKNRTNTKYPYNICVKNGKYTSRKRGHLIQVLILIIFHMSHFLIWL
jgi:hypothetical protein